MISEFVREQKRYTQNELCHILKCSEEHAIPLIRKLKELLQKSEKRFMMIAIWLI